jgi:hypothetical protein
MLLSGAAMLACFGFIPPVTAGQPANFNQDLAQVNFDCWVALSSVSSLAPESERCTFQSALQQVGVP